MRPTFSAGIRTSVEFSEEGTMKSKIFAVLAVAVIGVALASPLAAQTLALKANVPFEFNLAGKVMPAGEYLLQMDAGSAVLRVRNFDAGTAAIILGLPASASEGRTNDARITFNRYGDTYFLSTVVNGYSGAGFKAPISKSERELARTASAQKYEILGVLARL
jgi:hypothetical protein